MRDEAVARAISEIERFLPAGPDPLIALTAAPVLFRFPSPRGLRAVLDRGEFALTPVGVEAAFAGDLQTAFAYPWVEELGVIALLDPLPFGPRAVRARPGWFVLDGAQIVPAAQCVFVPSRTMAETLGVGMSRGEAVAAMGSDYEQAVSEKRARIDEYLALLPAIDARCRELLALPHRDGVRARLAAHGLSLDALTAPVFNLRPEQRRALLTL